MAMAKLFHSNKISPVIRIYVVFNDSKIAYASKQRFLGLNITEN